MLKLRLLFISVLVFFFCMSCNKDKSLRDPEGRKYNTVKIGNQVWMSENLNYDVGKGSYCYNNDSIRCLEMGRLYTWDAAMIAANEIEGWQLPKKEMWEELIDYCGGDSVAFATLITEKLGFNPQWAGVRTYTGEFKSAGLEVVNYWTSSLSMTDTLAWSLAVINKYEAVAFHQYARSNACSIRLVKTK